MPSVSTARTVAIPSCSAASISCHSLDEKSVKTQSMILSPVFVPLGCPIPAVQKLSCSCNAYAAIESLYIVAPILSRGNSEVLRCAMMLHTL